MIYRSKINGESPASVFEALLDQRGPLLNHMPVSDDVLARYEGRLPDLLLDFWQAHGVGDLAGGLLRLTVPDAFAGALAVLFRGDPDFEHDSHVIAYGPFGDLLIWHERHWLLFCGMTLAFVDAPFLFHPARDKTADQLVLEQVLGIDLAVLDLHDEADMPLFRRALTKLGRLAPGQIYGLQPPVSVGLPVELSRLEVTLAEEWLVQRFTGWTYTLTDFQARRLSIRDIGGPS
ncbi:GAD-like domain-containing protein [Paracoccus sulfuroxidans]|uniref:GAD-related domain-containing protein n=1 Tax=Paracoccus sulfuroxidans TaxID=384678 RepID=A0A562NVD7_9RHOB|nr:GAD-like domain-containing protein [Paracoccus sulfuroxidans]TWI36041.1 hypothetical protein IQ24_01404 [Paracoccus sulfuroxidans]